MTLSGDKSNALLFFPAAGYGDDASLRNAGSRGSFWSSSLGSSYPHDAYDLSFSGDYVYPQNFISVRYFGLSVRPLSD